MKTRIVPGRELTSKSLRAEDYMERPTLITVDWDYFVAEDPLWDIGHRENEMFLKWIWQTRYSLRDKMKTTGEEVGFWSKLRELFNISDRAQVYVSDSHAYAWQVAQWVERVVMFDAHHDCWEREPGSDQVHCHDWLRCWLEQEDDEYGRKAFWMPPMWTAESKCNLDDESVLFPLPEDMDLSKIEFAHPEYESIEDAACFVRGAGPIEFIHICRSGCWTPPWLDRQFIEFVESFNAAAEPVRLQEGPWDPMVERWSADDYSEARQAHELMEAQMRSIREERERDGK